MEYSRPNIKKMSNEFSIPTSEKFSFRHSVCGHGWYDLPPFDLDPSRQRLSYVFASRSGGRKLWIELRHEDESLIVKTSRKKDGSEAVWVARHLLRMDEELDEFYAAVRDDERLGWVEERSAGRLLRSATVFEDAVKTICTTNCTWSLTRLMTANLVEAFGEPAENGRKAFPTAESLAGTTEEYLRANIKTGYRSPYIIAFSELAASGKLDPESWLGSALPTEELRKEILSVKGIGPYAAENLLKLLGRYEGMALDSWLRSGFYKRYNREKPCPDKKIEKHYRRFGKWKGLAIWCDMTRSWFEEGDAGNSAEAQEPA